MKYPIDSLAAYQITRQFGPYLELDHLSNGQLSTVCNAADLNGYALETLLITRHALLTGLTKGGAPTACSETASGVTSPTPSRRTTRCAPQAMSRD